MLDIEIDDSAGIIRTVAAGSPTREQVEAYLYDLATLSQHIRSSFGSFRHLFDARGIVMDDSGDISFLSGVSIDAIEADDRTAIVMTDTHAIRIASIKPSLCTAKFFTDTYAAMRWLLDGDRGSATA